MSGSVPDTKLVLLSSSHPMVTQVQGLYQLTVNFIVEGNYKEWLIHRTDRGSETGLDQLGRS